VKLGLVARVHYCGRLRLGRDRHMRRSLLLLSDLPVHQELFMLLLQVFQVLRQREVHGDAGLMPSSVARTDYITNGSV